MSDAGRPALPVIDGDRCSLGRLAQSTCSACATACPHAALQAVDDGLTLDPAACTGCGACLAACPHPAISLEGLESLGPQPAGGGGAVALICPRRGDGAGPCLQALGLEALARLWLHGVRQIHVVAADCATCPDGKGIQVETLVKDMNRLLVDRGLPLLGLMPGQTVPKSVPRLTAMASPRAGRRAFLGLPAAPAPTGGQMPRALTRLQRLSGDPAVRFAFVPLIDPARCSGCDACLRICPEASLSLIKDEGGNMSYEATPSNCTGCGMCVDVCGEDAVTLDRMALPGPGVALTGFRCHGCGVEVHVPASGPLGQDGLCPVCAIAGHHKKLFQVIQ